MLFSLIIFVIGIVFGIVTFSFIKTKNTQRAWEKVQPYLFPFIISGVGIFLIIGNWSTFVDPPLVDSWAKLQTLVLKNRADEVLMLFGVFVGLLTILMFILSALFSNWTQVKLFGLFEATRITKEAKDKFKEFRAVEYSKFHTLLTLTTDVGLEAISSRIDSGSGNNIEFDTTSVMNDLRSDIESIFDSVKLSVKAKFIPSSDKIPQETRITEKALKKLRGSDGKNTVVENGGWDSTIAVRIVLGSASYDLWLNSTEYEFSESDQAFLLAIKNVLDSNVEKAVIRLYESQIAAQIDTI